MEPQEAKSVENEEKIGGYNKWDVESWLNSITTAAEVKKDAKKLAAVQELAKQQLLAAESKNAQVALEKKVGKKLNKAYKG